MRRCQKGSLPARAFHPYILERLGDPHAILVIDETSVRKRGNKSAGVGMQYYGITGQVENCQVGVFLDDKWNLENSHLSSIMWL
jgi:SRSO17 transposase